jgi:uncharacterized protein (DUF1786 family)
MVFHVRLALTTLLLFFSPFPVMSSPAIAQVPIAQSVHSSTTQVKTVAVFGSAYGGGQAGRLLSQHLPPDWRVVIVDRNTYARHKSTIYQTYPHALLP